MGGLGAGEEGSVVEMALLNRAGEAGGFDSGGEGVGVDRRTCSCGICGTAGGGGWERERPALEPRRSELGCRGSMTGAPFGIVLDDCVGVGVTEGDVDWDSGSVVAEFDLNQPNVLRFVFALVAFSDTNDDALDNDLTTPPLERFSFSNCSIAFCVRRYNSDFV